ncbi:hypothetical protein CAS74_004578 [Pichia kudriavzevii]|uniref:Mediator of RNA polymerase II transcription subunit 6 n=1 Tax=Pichia kudriavzevii TaxID=4909 RepID=A0A1Z8JIC5_PICKU|nr:hypothetical protein CAS74_004578 [Pichia kudriavzevii]
MTQLDEVEWRSPEFINAYGLRTDNVLEYLSLSPFWERTCSNQVLKMQRQVEENSMGVVPTFDTSLRKMRGIEFVLHHYREPDLWIIRKERRFDNGRFLQTPPGLGAPDDVTPLADIWVVGANVYMAPNILDVLEQHLLRTTLAMNNVQNQIHGENPFKEDTNPQNGASTKFLNTIPSKTLTTFHKAPAPPASAQALKSAQGRQPVLVRSATGNPTGLTGILQHPNPRPALISLYNATLAELKARFPPESIYRQSVENLTKARLAVVESNEVVEKIENEIGCGLIEEVIIQANEELELLKKMAEWKVWEPLEEKPLEDQWVYFGKKI